MKAAVLHAVGDLRYENVPVPEAAASEVLIKIRAAGVCGALFRDLLYRFAHPDLRKSYCP